MFLLLSVAFAGDNDFVSTDYSNAPQQIRYEGHLDAPPEAVFAALTDYAGMTAWMPKVSHVEVDNSQAEVEGGVGCERQCTFGSMELNERIVWWEEGVGYGYTVENGPVDDHVGVVQVESDGAGGTNLV